jgi:hypothetical protein
LLDTLLASNGRFADSKAIPRRYGAVGLEKHSEPKRSLNEIVAHYCVAIQSQGTET